MASRGTMGYVSGSAVQSVYAEVYGAATGGTGDLLTPPTGYSGIYFHSSLTLTVSKAGLFDVLAFGGGGAGAYGNNFNRCGGGGGAGQYSQQTIYLAAGSYNVKIGGGGAQQGGAGFNGSGTSIGDTVGNFAVGGGGGGGEGVGLIGGSGGGGNSDGSSGTFSVGCATTLC